MTDDRSVRAASGAGLDVVIEYYERDVDRTLLREDLGGLAAVIHGSAAPRSSTVNRDEASHGPGRDVEAIAEPETPSDERNRRD
jgi:hypothetical protein